MTGTISSSPPAVQAPPADWARPDGGWDSRWSGEGAVLVSPSPVPRAALRARAGARAVEWLGLHRTSLVVVAALLVVVGIVHGVGMNALPAPVDDEGTYMAQAWAVTARHALSPYTYWYDHPPLGWLILGGWSWLTHGFSGGHPAVVVGRQLVLAMQLIGAGLLYMVARRLGLGRPWAALAVLAWSLSPLDVVYGRMVYLDNLAVPWFLAALVMALSPRRNLWALSASGVLFASALLCKETLFILAPGILLQVWQQAARRTRAFCVTGFLTGTALTLGAYPLYALLKGELLPGRGHVSLYDAIRFQLFSRPSNGSVLAAHSAAHDIATSWLSLDAWLLGAGLVMLPVGLAVRRLRPVGLAYALGLLTVLRGGYLPQPYVIALLPLAALLLAGGAAWMWEARSEATGWWKALAGGAEAGRVGTPLGLGLRERSGALRRLMGSLLRRRRLGLGLRRLAVVGAAAAVLAGAVPAWARADRSAMRDDAWGPFRQAEAWILTHVPHGDRVLVDDTMWVDLVEHGFNHHLGVVWFYKLGTANNLDPSVSRALPHGWRDIDYVVATPPMRIAVESNPAEEAAVGAALAHSSVVAHFGRGDAEIFVKRLHHGGSHADTAEP